jgi:hypothetical protein
MSQHTIHKMGLTLKAAPCGARGESLRMNALDRFVTCSDCKPDAEAVRAAQWASIEAAAARFRASKATV